MWPIVGEIFAGSNASGTGRFKSIESTKHTNFLFVLYKKKFLKNHFHVARDKIKFINMNMRAGTCTRDIYIELFAASRMPAFII